MNKEEIYLSELKKAMNGRDLNSPAVLAYLKREQTDAAHKAMDIFAKQMAIEFAQWINGGHGCLKTIYAYEGDGVYIIYTPSPHPVPPQKITTQQLYTLFTNSINS